MSILILPHNIPHSLKHLSTLMDDIWYYAGDRSTDVSSLVCILATWCCPSSIILFATQDSCATIISYSSWNILVWSSFEIIIWPFSCFEIAQMNWYTKRAALTGIYNTTELVMLQDSSPDFQDTWTFLDNRIQDVVNMASTAKQVWCVTRCNYWKCVCTPSSSKIL